MPAMTLCLGFIYKRQGRGQDPTGWRPRTLDACGAPGRTAELKLEEKQRKRGQGGRGKGQDSRPAVAKPMVEMVMKE